MAPLSKFRWIRLVVVATSIATIGIGTGIWTHESGGSVRSTGLGVPGHRPGTPTLTRFWSSSPSNAANLPADCVPQNRPGAVGELGVVGVFGAMPEPLPNPDGLLQSDPGTLSTTPSGPDSVSVLVPNISGKLCGKVDLTPSPPGSPRQCPVSGTLTVPPDGQKFASDIMGSVKAIPGITPSVPFTPSPGLIQGTIVCNQQTINGTLEAAVNATVGGGAGLFGLDCVVNVHLNITSNPSGSISSQPGWYLGGKFVDQQFPVPAVGPSSGCPAGIATTLNSLVGLPLVPGEANLTLPYAIEIYAP